MSIKTSAVKLAKGAAGWVTGPSMGWVYLVAATALASAGAWTISWHNNQITDLVETNYQRGLKEKQTEWDLATANAKEIQSTANDDATETNFQEVEVIKWKTIERKTEVTKYVPNPDTSCPADADFVRLFNQGAGTQPGGGDAEDK